MNGTRWKIALTSLVGLLICVLILSTGPEPLEASIPEGNPRVTIGDLKRSEVQQKVVAYGTLTPRQTLHLTTQVPGEVVWVNEKLVPGGLVGEGETLFRIDDRDYAIALASAEARHAQAQAQIDIEEGRAEIAQLEWSAWRSTEGVDLQANPLALREPQKAEAIAQRKIILAELAQARLALDRTSVGSSWPASVVSANAIVGQVLSVGEVTATLFPLDHAIVELQIPVAALRLIDAGIEKIELRAVDNPDSEAVNGIFESVVKTLTEDTRLVTVRVRVDAPLQHPGWAFGMHLVADIVGVDEQTVAMLPPDLIVSGNLVWIYRNGRAERHQVFPLEEFGEFVSVRDNFGASDALILERPIGLFDGALVDAGRVDTRRVDAEGADAGETVSVDDKS